MGLHQTTIPEAEIHVVGKETKAKVKQARILVNGDKFVNPDNRICEYWSKRGRHAQIATSRHIVRIFTYFLFLKEGRPSDWCFTEGCIS